MRSYSATGSADARVLDQNPAAVDHVADDTGNAVGAAAAYRRIFLAAVRDRPLAYAGNVLAVDDSDADGYQVTLGLKMTVVALSGLTAWLHERATTPRDRGLYGALTGLTALLALFLGVLLAD